MEANNEYIDYSFLKPYMIYYQDGFDLQLLQTDNPNELIRNLWKSTKNLSYDQSNKGIKCVEFFNKIITIQHPLSEMHDHAFIKLKNVVLEYITDKIRKNRLGDNASKLFYQIINGTESTEETLQSEMDILDQFSLPINTYDSCISQTTQKRVAEEESQKKSSRAEKRKRSSHNQTQEIAPSQIIKEKVLTYVSLLRSGFELSFVNMAEKFEQLERHEILQMFGLRLDTAFDSDETGFEVNNEYIREKIDEQFDLIESDRKRHETIGAKIPQAIHDALWFLMSIKQRFE